MSRENKIKQLRKLYYEAQKRAQAHQTTVSEFDNLARELWSEEALDYEYGNDRGLTAVILYAEARSEFSAFCKRMDEKNDLCPEKT